MRYGRGSWGRPYLVLSSVVALVLALACMGCASSASKPADAVNYGGGLAVGPDPESSSTVTSKPTKADVQDFVEAAAQFARVNGKDAALKTFTEAGGPFHQGELYIYAYDFSGTVIAHGGDKTLVGKNLIKMKDPNGVMVIKELVKTAKKGNGWVQYTWANPANGNKQEAKLGYVVKIDDTWFLGSGMYGTGKP